MPLRDREPGGERTRAPRRSTARRRRQKDQRLCAHRAEDHCRSIAPSSSCLLYDTFPTFVTAGRLAVVTIKATFPRTGTGERTEPRANPGLATGSAAKRSERG